MALLDPRNGPELDLPPFDGPGRGYVIASSPRTGSTLLARLLWETGRAGAPKEYLNPMQVRDWEARLAPVLPVRWAHRALVGPLSGLAGRGRWSEARLRAYLGRVRRRRTGPTGWFGLKLHHHHAQRWFFDRGLHPEDVLGPLRWIHVRRRDRVAQAVSWHKARQTGQWASWQPRRSAPTYVRAALARRMADIAAAEAGWASFFQEGGVEPLRVDFEDLVADPERTVRRVLAHLGDPDAGTIPVPAAPTAPQSDGLNRAWRARFLRSPEGR